MLDDVDETDAIAPVAEMPEDSEDAAESDEDAPDGPSLPLLSVIEAVLFAAREPLKAAQIARAVGKGTRQDAVRTAIDELNVQYLDTSRAFEIAEISGRFQLMSRPEFVSHIMKIYPKKELVEKDRSSRLTPAALDTLAIIAYKQPVTRGDIEHIRGVGCGPVLKALIERGSVRVAGKRTDLVGQPLMYGTTEAFLAEFGLGSIEELPLRNEFLGMLGEPAPMAPEATGEEEGAEEQAETGFVIVPTPEPGTPEAEADSPDDEGVAEEDSVASEALQIDAGQEEDIPE